MNIIQLMGNIKLIEDKIDRMKKFRLILLRKPYINLLKNPKIVKNKMKIYEDIAKELQTSVRYVQNNLPQLKNLYKISSDLDINLLESIKEPASKLKEFKSVFLSEKN